MSDHFLLPLPVCNPIYALSSSHPSDFKLPPLDGSLTLPEIYSWHLLHNPQHTCFIHEDGAGGFKNLTYADIVPAADRAAHFVAHGLGIDVDDITSPPTVAVVATSDTITHFCTLLGLIRAGIPFIAITPHNSPTVVAHLARKVDAQQILFSSEPSVVNVVETAREESSKEYGRDLGLIPMPVFEDIFHGPHKKLKDREYDLDSTPIYAHSSGSTSLPKPIPWSHKFLLQGAVTPLFGDHNFCNTILAWHSASLSHGSGMHVLFFMPSTGMRVAVFPPANPATFPSPGAAYQAFANVKADYLISFPKLIETWAEDPVKVDVLKQAKGIIYAGSMLNKRVGDLLAEAGVSLFPLFGMCEAGIVGTVFPASQGMDWEYISLTPHSGGKFIDAGDGTYELIVVDQPLKRLPVPNMKYGDVNAHGSSDLFTKHPNRPGFWRGCGRKDDRIIHPSGEKTNPILMENIIAIDPKVKTALVFGNGRNQTGILLQLEQEYVFDPTDDAKMKAFRAYIQPRITEANSVSPKYSKLFPEMIWTTRPDKPFKYTEKGSLMRAAVLRDYEQEINILYDAVESRIHSDIKIPASWSFSDSIQFIHDVLNKENIQVGENDNVFFHGCDSLRATRIEIIIRNALKRTGSDTNTIDALRNFVYDHPTPRELAVYVSEQATSGSPASDIQSTLVMDKMINHYGSDFSASICNDMRKEVAGEGKHASGAVVLVTGTTGGLGAEFLAVLAEDPSVSHIYAVNRGRSGPEMVGKQKEALAARGLDPDIAVRSNVTLLAGDLVANDLGLNHKIREKLLHSLTHIYHISWNVNWNVSLSSFEHLLRGLRNLIDFALSSRLPTPPRLIFTSTIGVFRNIEPGFVAPEQSIEDIRITAGNGYSESKVVAEKIIERAIAETPLEATIVRLGQVSGNRGGSWNVSEWFPAMIKSSLVLKSLPEVEGLASFIPADIAARTLNEIRNTDATIMHISHPRPVPLRTLLVSIGRELDLPLVPYEKWLASLEHAEAQAVITDINDIPALKILPFFRINKTEQLPRQAEVFGLPTLSTQVSTKQSQSLASATPLDAGEAVLWLRYWRGLGFIEFSTNA